VAIQTSIAGAYTGTYNAVDVAHTSNGFELTFNSHSEDIKDTDLYGESLIDWIYRGGTHEMAFESKVFKAGSITPFWPWGALGVIATTAAPIARLASAVAAAMALSVVASTPAQNTTPSINTLTASKSLLKPNSNLKLLFSSKVRVVPVQLVCLPSESGGNVTAFATT